MTSWINVPADDLRWLLASGLTARQCNSKKNTTRPGLDHLWSTRVAGRATLFSTTGVSAHLIRGLQVDGSFAPAMGAPLDPLRAAVGRAPARGASVPVELRAGLPHELSYGGTLTEWLQRPDDVWAVSPDMLSGVSAGGDGTPERVPDNNGGTPRRIQLRVAAGRLLLRLRVGYFSQSAPGKGEYASCTLQVMDGLPAVSRAIDGDRLVALNPRLLEAAARGFDGECYLRIAGPLDPVILCDTRDADDVSRAALIMPVREALIMPVREASSDT